MVRGAPDSDTVVRVVALKLTVVITGLGLPLSCSLCINLAGYSLHCK